MNYCVTQKFILPSISLKRHLNEKLQEFEVFQNTFLYLNILVNPLYNDS